MPEETAQQDQSTNTADATAQQPGSAPEAPATYEQFVKERNAQSAGTQTTDAAAEPKPEDQKTADAAASGEQKTEGQQEQQADDEKSADARRGGLDKRFSRLTRRNYELKAQNEELQQRLRDMESRPTKQPEPPPAAKPPEAAKPAEPAADMPTPDKYDTYEKYLQAFWDWRGAQLMKQAREEAEKIVNEKLQQRDDKVTQDKQKDEATKQVEEWNRKVEAVRAVTPDYDELFAGVLEDDLDISEAMRAAMLTSDLGAEVMVHLARNRDECRRIAGLQPLAAVREIGKIEARLVAHKPPQKDAAGDGSPNPPKPRKTTTAAPRPPATVAAKTPAAPTPDQTGDYAEFKRRREAQLNG